ncbi:TetR/AcrR family transcriptional regulator [Pedobacter sp. ISL-68]|uniref:TetR/AcrR family transcriptional regulator n=1 Tax=unclassified Pedobacter TaxID=2628915 RepID=UPI001BE6510A|nr:MULTISPECIES: TetR/AcrR family transcriptional regulator [unclassified Pedobacter]MBT2560080.1 TetR/AcrR family transcriptional regulator [Pedobacter sp. ISL-64]MBT2589059.1 TetR/AcrR family transcriptional regulator [Pedobacter sp. ISL-68]
MSKAERTRQYIIEKTAPLFNRKGYVGTTMSDIMEVTGLSKGGIYGSFAKKDEVMVAAFRFNHQRLQDNFNKKLKAKVSFKEKLLAYPQHYKGYFEHLMRSGGCPIQNTAIEADDTHPLLKKLAGDALEVWKKQLIGFIEGGIARGEFSARAIDPERTALTIISAIEGAVMVSMLSGKTSELGLVMDSVTKLITDLD